MKLYKKNIAILMAGLLALSSGALVTSCDEDDDYDTNQFASGSVTLTAASLQVTRGAYMTFKGVNLNRITSIQFPGGASSTPEVVDEYTIKCLVPEEAEPGTVKLIYDGGELETKEISFTEPITFDAFTPESVTAGDELTIKGTYLTYISFVQFATGENVEVEPASRTEFKVVVPVDASTGKINLGYYSVDGKDTVETLLQSEVELTVIETSDAKLTNTTVKAGNDVEITGKLLRLVKSVTFQGVDAIDVAAEDPTKDVEKIVVSLPAAAQDGEVTLTLFSGNTVSAGNITTVVPTGSIKDAKASYGVGETVVIEGENLDLIASAQFDGEASATAISTAEGAVYTRDSDGNIVLTVPAAAKSGDITLALANGSSIKVSGFVTTKPVFTFPSSATPLDVLNIESTLASRITTVKFGDIEAAATAKDGSFSVTVPLTAESGKVTYVMDNGEEVVACESFTVNSFTFCAFADADAFTSGTYTVNSLASATVVNGGNLDNVLLNGKDTKFLLTGETLYVYVGSVTGTQTVTLVTGTTKVDYSIEVTASGVIENVIWTGPVEITWNDGGRVIIKWSDLENVPAGSILRLYFNGKDGVWAQAQLNNGAWDNETLGILKPSDISEYNWWDGGAAEEHIYEITLTQEILTYLKSNVGACEDVSDAALIIHGSDLIFSKVSVVIDYSAPKSIWSGSFSNAGWAGNQDLAWGGYDWSTVKAGQTLYFTVEKVNKGAWGCLSLRHGNNWGALVDAVNEAGNNQFDVGDDVDATTITFTLTQAAIDDLVANGGLVMTGDNLIVTNVAIK